MKRIYDFKQVDVFTNKPLEGNPVAVIIDAKGLDTSEMQRMAAWTNLSETTFVLPPNNPGADYLLRIFTPKEELPFAGHPTIGSAHAVLEEGVMVEPSVSKLVQECSAGLIELDILDDYGQKTIFFTAPPATITNVEETHINRIAEVLGNSLAQNEAPRIVEIGPKWLIAEIQTEQALRKLTPNFHEMSLLSQEMGVTGLTVFGFTGNEENPIYVRSFTPSHGIPEDPVCGSGNASVAAYLLETGLLDKSGDTYLANQGQELARNGLIQVQVDRSTKTIRIGGEAVTCVDGQITV